ncbi:MAG: hypothetical protein AAGF26_07055 [Cyanobacteria bacterium P01_G01_bin.49]
MKINSTIKLTLLLLIVMSGAGTASAYFAYRAGSDAVQGVNQPDINPTKKLKDIKKTSTKPVKFKPVDEKTILIKVYNHTHDDKKKSDDADQKSEKETKQEEKETNQSLDNKSNPEDNSQPVANLPLKVTDSGVSLQISEASNQDNTITLKVNLKNEGTEPIRFLYSFLEVTDNQGRFLSAMTEGLPEKLPPNSENFIGMIKIPSALVNDSQTLALNLTDYPDQKLKLSLGEIPIIR